MSRIDPRGPHAAASKIATFGIDAKRIMNNDGDLGFTYRSRKTGEIQVLHHGKLAATLRGTDAADFIAEVEHGDAADAQQLMARLTGNYKRGNERTASEHPRNRR